MDIEAPKHGSVMRLAERGRGEALDLMHDLPSRPTADLQRTLRGKRGPMSLNVALPGQTCEPRLPAGLCAWTPYPARDERDGADTPSSLDTPGRPALSGGLAGCSDASSRA